MASQLCKHAQCIWSKRHGVFSTAMLQQGGVPASRSSEPGLCCLSLFNLCFCLPVGGFPLPRNPQAAKGTDVHTAQPKCSHPALALKAAVSQHGQASFPSWSSLISLGVECDPQNVSTALGFGFKCTEELGPYSLWDFLLGVLGIDLTESHSNTTSGNLLPQSLSFLIWNLRIITVSTFFDGLV